MTLLAVEDGLGAPPAGRLRAQGPVGVGDAVG